MNSEEVKEQITTWLDREGISWEAERRADHHWMLTVSLGEGHTYIVCQPVGTDQVRVVAPPRLTEEWLSALRRLDDNQRVELFGDIHLMLLLGPVKYNHLDVREGMLYHYLIMDWLYPPFSKNDFFDVMYKVVNMSMAVLTMLSKAAGAEHGFQHSETGAPPFDNTYIR